MGIQNKFLLFSFAVFLFFGWNKSNGEEGRKPNVIIILADDLGTRDLNSFGAKDLYTPNLDSLAAKGIRFTQFYASSSICSPSRASLMTGKYPQTAGLPGNASPIYGVAGMPKENLTMAEIFGQNGYATAHIGKWHLGFTPETMPNGQGFQYSFGNMVGCIDNYSHFFYWNGPNRHDLWENGKEIFMDGVYYPSELSRRAIEYINENKDHPFFLYFAMNTPHYPLQPEKKWRDYYKDLDMPRRDYAAFVSTTDEYAGKVIDAVKNNHLEKNTVIIFLSDNGHSCEERSFFGGGYTGEYRGCKFSLFEGGIRVPAIISWPGMIISNKIVDEVCLEMDLLPTLVEICKLSVPEISWEGHSFAGSLTGNFSTRHELVFWKLNNQWAVRKGDWKLVGNPKDPSASGTLDKINDSLFLVNLKNDPSEKTNLRFENPEKLMELINEYINWEYSEKNDIPKNK